MAATKLAEALNDCLINFDSRILVTDLLQEYNLSYDEVHKTLEEYLKQQENKGTKYEKRFLVQGFEQEGDNEIYTVVKGETKLREWMEKLKNVESRLYAVEVSGGARTPAQIFKPVEKCLILIDNMEERVSGNANSSHLNDNAHTTVATTTAKSASAASKSTKAKKAVPFTGRTTTIASANVVEKELIITAETEKPKSDNIEQPPTQSSPKKTKAVAKKNTNKSQPIAISNFFTAAARGKPPTKPVTETKPTAVKCEQSGGSSDSKSAVTLTKSTKQADDIMKLSCTEGSLEKSSESSDEEEVINANKAIEKQATTNKRSYVFDSTSEPTLKKSLESSDEEEVISAMKLDIINSDNETEEQATTNKRRRVIDSDSDNEPEQKHEKIDVIEVAEEEDNKINKSETFLDDEDFVVTVKSKGKPSKKTSPRLKPPAKMPAKRKPPTASTKTKQVNITDFFGKK
ncbi:uncharacterized protein LOC119687428 [Teleopsis dalmanni]|uniref:uncharacterized protein LOC119687428 n=1 Tax=Teleopsis dalmanni TaxID=139649 RepID=UPI0018CCA253|nr:uncharacterized protein LOC119687428 [Teleopsis dalmanni]